MLSLVDVCLTNVLPILIFIWHGYTCLRLPPLAAYGYPQAFQPPRLFNIFQYLKI